MQIPASPDVEKTLLGYVLSTPTAMDDSRAVLEISDFTGPHQIIWRRCCELYDAGTPIDYVTLVALLDNHSESAAVGGVSYLVDLTTGLPVGPSVEPYISILRDKSARRRIILASQRLALEAMDESTSPAGIVEHFVSTVSVITDGAQSNRPISTTELVEQVGIDRLLGPRRHHGVKLPWATLENDLKGFGPGQMIVLMAETSRGKTSFAMQVATAAALQGCAPLIWTMEMSPESLYGKLVTQLSGVPKHFSNLNFEQHQARHEAIAHIGDHPIYFDRNSRSVGSFCASIRQLRPTKVGIGIVDYIGLIRASSRTQTRAQEVSDNSRALKMAAMDFGIPLLVLCQVDRSSVKNGGEIGLHSAKESGDIENDADVVLWVKSPEPFSRDSDTLAKFWVGKQREGPAGFGIDVVFRPSSQTFQEYGERQ